MHCWKLHLNNLKIDFSIFRFFAPSDSRFSNIVPNHTSMEILFIQFQMMHTSQFHKHWLVCAPGSTHYIQSSYIYTYKKKAAHTWLQMYKYRDINHMMLKFKQKRYSRVSYISQMDQSDWCCKEVLWSSESGWMSVQELDLIRSDTRQLPRKG